MILLLLLIYLSAAVGNQSIFFRHARKFFPIEAIDRLKKFLGKSDVSWSNT